MYIYIYSKVSRHIQYTSTQSRQTTGSDPAPWKPAQKSRAESCTEESKRWDKRRESSLLASLEDADRFGMRCDLSKLSCCEIVDGVLCLLVWDSADQMTTDTANPIAPEEHVGQTDHQDSSLPWGERLIELEAGLHQLTTVSFSNQFPGICRERKKSERQSWFRAGGLANN